MNKIKELLETSGYWIFAIIAMVVFYFGQSNQDNKNHDIEMAKAGLHQIPSRYYYQFNYNSTRSSSYDR